MGTDINGVFQKRQADRWVCIKTGYNGDRHYQLFAVLADVRNGRGFAGAPTGEYVPPISPPRGFPVDFQVDLDGCANLEYAEWYRFDPEKYWMGDHSFSWLTGEEMLIWYRHAPTVRQFGILSREAYTAWDGVSMPVSYCGGISGPGVVLINDTAAEKQEHPGWTHIRVHWQQDLKEDLAYFFNEVARLVEKHGEIRFVFGFDS